MTKTHPKNSRKLTPKGGLGGPRGALWRPFGGHRGSMMAPWAAKGDQRTPWGRKMVPRRPPEHQNGCQETPRTPQIEPKLWPRPEPARKGSVVWKASIYYFIIDVELFLYGFCIVLNVSHCHDGYSVVVYPNPSTSPRHTCLARRNARSVWIY